MLLPVSLLLVRVGVALRLTPFLGGRPLPLLPWAALSVCLVMVLGPSALAPFDSSAVGLGGWLVLALREALTGAVLGLAAKLAFAVLELAGGLLGDALPAVFQANGTGREQRSPIASFYVLFGTAAFLLMDGHHALISALAGSLVSFPPVGAAPAGDLLSTGLESIVGLFSGAFAFAVMVAAPVFVAGLAAEVVTGLASRIAPALDQGAGSQGLRTIAVQLALVAFLGASVTAAVGFLRDGIEHLTVFGG
ncbi:MAG: flagellar biosynthetic protein FliR [Deltaproteobacteria bacterium]|nr:flagellar biosynthetic protein FliR [Deltaproteobacteria bacterium]